MPKTNHDPDYANLVDLLGIAAVADQRLAEMQTDLDDAMIAAVDDRRAEYVEHQAKLAAAIESIETIVRRHPEWFAKTKTLKTPYGSVRSTSSSPLKVASEQSTIRLIKAAGRADEFIRTKEELDKDALEKLTADQLAEFGLSRESKETIKITPAKIDMGKTVQAAGKAGKEAA